MRRNLYLSSLLLLLFCVSCANRVMPTGGSRDMLPPVAVEATPAQFTTGFKGDRIEIRFDEYVQLIDHQKQIVFSPPILPLPRVEIRKKSVWITFRDTLAPNTTYNIQFGNAIADIHENTPIAGFRYVFSTGNTIDSAFIMGQVLDALTALPAKESIVTLYSENVEDSMVFKADPDYFTRADSTGHFRLTNVKPGRYKVTAILDKNYNHVADPPGEHVAYINEIQELADSLNIMLRLSSSLPVPLTVKSSVLEPPGKLVTVFSAPAPAAAPVLVEHSNIDTRIFRSFLSDTIIIWTLPAVSDTFTLAWTSNGIVLDTVKYQVQRGTKETAISKSFVTGDVYPAAGGKLSAERFPMVRWQAPLVKTDTSGIVMFRDSIPVPVLAKAEDSLQTRTRFEFERSPGQYRIMVPPGAVTDIYQRSNDTLNFSFTIPAERTAGSISIDRLSADSVTSIVQLVNDKYELVAERNFSGGLNTSFYGLEPGSYFLRLVYDINGNRRWDPGDFENGIQPENVIYYPEKITVRSNWEVELEWHDSNR